MALAHRDLRRPLLLAHHTVYAVVSRFVGQGHAAFDDRQARGPRPLLGKVAGERVEKLLEEDSPTDHGWLRSRWSCKLIALQLLRERLASVSRETVRRTLHRLEYRWRRPRPVPPERDSEEQIEEKRARLEDVLRMSEEAGSFFQDETKLETNPKVGFCWMRKGRQRRLKTSGTNRKVWVSGALNFKTGRFHWVTGGRRNGELFIKLLDKLRRTYRCHRQLHLATGNDSSHLSERVRKYVEDSGGRIRLHPLPSSGLRKATRWSWCGGLCTRRSAATTSAPGWTTWWSSRRAISRKGSRSG